MVLEVEIEVEIEVEASRQCGQVLEGVGCQIGILRMPERCQIYYIVSHTHARARTHTHTHTGLANLVRRKGTKSGMEEGRGAKSCHARG